jgi:protein-S-isoprenylcysteine O-methyltransferase Ste14
VAWGNFLFRRRNIVFPVVLVGLCVAFPPTGWGNDSALDRWLDLAAIGLGVGGLALRATVIGFAYIKRGGVNRRIHADRLVTEGFFGLSRNPLYLGNILTWLGLFLILNNIWAYLVGVPFILFAYVSMVAAEEAYLRQKFGAAYEAYCRRVNRWWPQFGKLPKLVRTMQFDWRRVVIKDYTTICAWSVAALILFAYDIICDPGISEATLELSVLAWGLAVLLGATIAIRIAKKRGWLNVQAHG